MIRIPILPAIIVSAACATMIALGFWQLRRADWKEGLIVQYAAARSLPPMAYPAVPPMHDLPLFRRAIGLCLQVTEWRSVSGRNINGEPGWVHIARCRTGTEGPGLVVDAGWSRSPSNPVWKGGPVSGIITTDPQFVIRLVSDKPLAAPLQQSAPPSPSEIPNNHLAYAIQWFLFALIAAIIFLLALRWRPQS